MQRLLKGGVAFILAALVCDAARLRANNKIVHGESEFRRGGAQYFAATNTLKYVDLQPGATKTQLAAYASYSPANQHSSNFAQLRITTNLAYPNVLQTRSAGYLEGYLTAEVISNHFKNMQWWIQQQTNETVRVYQWLEENYRWLISTSRARAEEANNQDRNEGAYWEAIDVLRAQVDGMVEGYRIRHKELAATGTLLQDLSHTDFLFLNSVGDTNDILPSLADRKGNLGEQWVGLAATEVASRIHDRTHCSVVIKVTGDLSDLLVGHATWFTYVAMNRIYKHYNFQLQGDSWRNRRTSMSSYPAQIASVDDFYILGDTHLVVTETTNAVYDLSLYDMVSPYAALSWQRVLLSNLLSSNGADWAYWFSQHNSGTYNNQYMVVDLKRFSPGQELQPGLLTVLEQIPGQIVWADMTHDLERGYWPSYNVPFFPEIYNKSGYPQTVSHLSEVSVAHQAAMAGLKYQVAPRAQLFRRDAGGVQDVAGLKALLRSNGWGTADKYQFESPYEAVCGRGDLKTEGRRAAGCNDAKVTSYTLAMQGISEAVNGPSLGSAQQLPPWSPLDPTWAHLPRWGLPPLFDFSFEVQRPDFDTHFADVI